MTPKMIIGVLSYHTSQSNKMTHCDNIFCKKKKFFFCKVITSLLINLKCHHMRCIEKICISRVRNWTSKIITIQGTIITKYSKKKFISRFFFFKAYLREDSHHDRSIFFLQFFQVSKLQKNGKTENKPLSPFVPAHPALTIIR